MNAGAAAAGDLSPPALLGPSAANGPAALAATQAAFMQELFADTLGFAGRQGRPISAARLMAQHTQRLQLRACLDAEQQPAVEPARSGYLIRSPAYCAVRLGVFTRQAFPLFACSTHRLSPCCCGTLCLLLHGRACCAGLLLCCPPAGAFIIRRLVGIAHTADMDSIADADVRAACELRALRFGRHLLVEGAATYKDIRTLAAAAAAARQVDGLPADGSAAVAAVAAKAS